MRGSDNRSNASNILFSHYTLNDTDLAAHFDFNNPTTNNRDTISITQLRDSAALREKSKRLQIMYENKFEDTHRKYREGLMHRVFIFCQKQYNARIIPPQTFMNRECQL